jgi:hypothetical protein
MTIRICAALALGALFFAGGASAQEKQTAMDKATAAAAGGVRKQADEAAIAMPESPSEVVLADPATRQQYLASMQRYYEYRANGYTYRSRVFEWQLLSSRLIFLIVVVLVGCGIYFAWIQFRSALLVSRRAEAAGAAAAAVPSPLATQLEVSAKGITLNSSVLGVIILGLSLAFFYLYLVYVYPIQNVF